MVNNTIISSVHRFFGFLKIESENQTKPHRLLIGSGDFGFEP
jgi:hypothetical protein